MRSMAAFAALIGVVILLGWTVEQRMLWSNPSVQVQRDVREQALRALDHVERQLETLRPSAGSTAALRDDAIDEVERLRSRVRTIRAKVDSLGENAGSRRGAWAGVRANIAELEYRADMALLAAHREARTFRSEIVQMLDDTEVQIRVVREALTPQAQLDHGARLDAMEEGLTRLRRETADAPGDERGFTASRDAWAKRLATLRRELRAIARSLDVDRRSAIGPARSGSRRPDRPWQNPVRRRPDDASPLLAWSDVSRAAPGQHGNAHWSLR